MICGSVHVLPKCGYHGILDRIQLQCSLEKALEFRAFYSLSWRSFIVFLDGKMKMRVGLTTALLRRLKSQVQPKVNWLHASIMEQITAKLRYLTLLMLNLASNFPPLLGFLFPEGKIFHATLTEFSNFSRNAV